MVVGDVDTIKNELAEDEPPNILGETTTKITSEEPSMKQVLLLIQLISM